MAYPVVSGPYGFLPEQNLAGRVYNAATIDIPISSGYGYNIGYGDLVAIDNTGHLIRVDLGAGPVLGFGIPPIGIFVGCSYTDPNLKYFLEDQWWQANTLATDAVAKVVNDPDVILKAALTDAAGNIITTNGATQATIGQNIGYFQANGSSPGTLVNTITKDSVASLDLTSVASPAPTLPWRVYAPVTQTALPDGTFCELFVTYNWNQHFYRQANGI